MSAAETGFLPYARRRPVRDGRLTGEATSSAARASRKKRRGEWPSAPASGAPESDWASSEELVLAMRSSLQQVSSRVGSRSD